MATVEVQDGPVISKGNDFFPSTCWKYHQVTAAFLTNFVLELKDIIDSLNSSDTVDSDRISHGEEIRQIMQENMKWIRPGMCDMLCSQAKNILVDFDV
jgi:hypothetical protein